MPQFEPVALLSPGMQEWGMTEGYEPPSEFLKMVIEDIVPLAGHALADLNRRRLIAYTADADRANRDWATMLLAQTGLDDAEVRQALLRAAEDEDEEVRAEAIFGLAERDTAVARPFVERELKRDKVGRVIFEAAELVAHPGLLPDLRDFAAPSDDSWVDEQVDRAIAACEAAARG
jgi:HEAT repeat protein